MRKVLLGDICKPKQWKTISTSMLTEEGYSVYGANGVIGKYSEYNHKEETLLVTCRGATCGRLNICEPYSYVNGNAMALDDLDESVDIRYLYYVLKERGFKDVISGSAQPQIIRSTLEKIPILIGTKTEQKEIVRKLALIDKCIEGRKSELQQLDELIKSRFVEMFDNKKYPRVRLGDICSKITDGTHKTPNYLADGVTFISAKNIVNGELDFSDIKHISEEEYQEIQNRCQTEKYDILLSKSGSLGTPVIVRTAEKLGLFESLAVIKYNREQIIPEFLCEQIKSYRIQRQFKTGKKGVAIKHLHLGVIADTKIIIPTMDEQRQFANFVKQVDKSKLTNQNLLMYILF